MNKKDTQKANRGKSLLPRIALLLARKSPKKQQRESVSAWIQKARQQTNFNKFRVGSLFHETFQTHTNYSNSQNPNRWLGSAKSIPKGQVSPLKDLPRSTSVPPKSLGSGKIVLCQEEERRLERFGSRLGSTLPEVMTNAGHNEIAYLGDGQSVILERKSVASMLSSLELTQTSLWRQATAGAGSSRSLATSPALSGPQTSVDAGVDRYGHTGPWYKRTPRRDQDSHGLQDLLHVAGSGSRTDIRGLTNINSLGHSIIPWDALEGDEGSTDQSLHHQSSLHHQQSQQQSQQQQLQNVVGGEYDGVLTPVSKVYVSSGGSQVIPAPVPEDENRSRMQRQQQQQQHHHQELQNIKAAQDLEEIKKQQEERQERERAMQREKERKNRRLSLRLSYTRKLVY